MQIHKINNQSYTNQTSFAAKLKISDIDRTLMFSKKSKMEIENVFKKNTKGISGEIELVSGKRVDCTNPYKDEKRHWLLKFKNKDHEDFIEGFMPNYPLREDDFAKKNNRIFRPI